MTSPESDSRLESTTVAPIGCQNCRDQHLKCDRKTPSCSRCLASGRQCSRGYRFRVKTGPFTRKQQWVKTPTTLEFVDDSAAIDDDEDTLGLNSSSWLSNLGDRIPQQGHTLPGPGGKTHRRVLSVSSHAATVGGGSVQSPSSTTSTTANSRATQHDHVFRLALAAPVVQGTELAGHHGQDLSLRSQSPSDRFIVHDDEANEGNEGNEGGNSSGIFDTSAALDLHAAINSVQPRIYLENTVFPLQNKQEAILLRHYVENPAVWLDICDPDRHFASTVPLQAGTCTVLLNAVLALSAKHLAHVSNFDPYASDRYHRECLSVLIPLMSHEVTAADENLFAATIVLRVWEEMEVKHTGIDSHSYILGIHAFVHGHGHNLRPRTLGAASFWAGLRQEIYTSTMNQMPVKAPLLLSLVQGARDFTPVDDCDWANRAVIHCVDVLNFCFGDTPPQHSWDDLYAWNQRWTASLPPSYAPTLDRERGPGEAFPEVWYHNTWHATGVQHHILAELFLVSFDPRIPRIGGQRREAAKRVDERICALVRRMCGIGLSNQRAPPSMFTACMAISAFGDRFRQRFDQEALLDVLRRTEKDHGRPTESVQKQMMESWDWAETSVT